MQSVEVDLLPGMRLQVLSRSGTPRTVKVRSARTQRATLTPAQLIELGRPMGKRGTLRLHELSDATRAEIHRRYGTTELKPLIARGLVRRAEDGRLDLIVRPPCVWWREGDETLELELPPTWTAPAPHEAAAAA